MYKAIRAFTDLQDGNYKYNPGDEYPRVGLIPSEERIQELLTSNNRRKKPMIKEVVEEVKVEKPKRTRKPKSEAVKPEEE